MDIVTSPLGTEQQALLDLTKQACKGNLLFFAKRVLGRTRLNDRIHGPSCRYMTQRLIAKQGLSMPTAASCRTDWDKDDGREDQTDKYIRITRARGSRLKLDLEPRETFKSTRVMAAMLWIPATIDPDSAIMYCAETQRLADTTITEADEHITKNVLFRYLFGRWEEGSKWQERQKWYSIRRNPKRTPSLSAVSVGSALTGEHPDYIFLDDIVSKDNVGSEVERSNVRHFFDATFALLPQHGCMWVTGTRWSIYDLYGDHIMREMAEDFDFYVRAVYHPNGELWYPEEYPPERIESLKRIEGKFLFSSQRLLKPVPREEQSLEHEKIVWFDPEAKVGEPGRKGMPAEKDMVVLIGCDPAGSRGRGNSDWAMPVAGFWNDESGNPHSALLDYRKAAITATHAVEEIIKLIKRWRPQALVVEQTGFSQNFIDATLRPALRKAGILIPVVEVKTGGRSKDIRILTVQNGLGALMEQGCIHARQDAEALKVEVEIFTADNIDKIDLIDMWAYLCQLAQERNWYPRPAKVDEMTGTSSDYRELYEEACRTLSKAAREQAAIRGGEGVLDEAIMQATRRLM